LPTHTLLNCSNTSTNKNSHLGGGGNAVDVDYGSMHFEVSQLDVSLDVT
jgi:hypothetical protein